MPAAYSPKQLEVLTRPSKRWNILCGVTGSGKSHIVNLRHYVEALSLKDGEIAIYAGNTSDSLERNVIIPMHGISADDEGQHLEFVGDEIRCPKGGIIKCYGVNNAGASNRMQGGSVKYLYFDEPTTFSQQNFDMLTTRARMIGDDGYIEWRPVWMTMNPDEEMHFIKTDFIDKRDDAGMDMNYWWFDFWDNPIMTQGFIDGARRSYHGEFADRMIEGKWIGAKSDKVVPEFNSAMEIIAVAEHKRPELFHSASALDPGMVDLSAYLLGYYDFEAGRYVIEREWIGREANTETMAKAIREIEAEYASPTPIVRWSDTDLRLIADLQNMHGMPFNSTKKDHFYANVNHVRALFARDAIRIHPRCKVLINHLRRATWNKTRTQFNREKECGHFDALAALCYIIRNMNTYKNPFEKDKTIWERVGSVPIHDDRKHSGINKIWS